MDVHHIHSNLTNATAANLVHVRKMDDDEDDGDRNKTLAAARFYAWPSSRIVRVSRASGGKDRHSKVLTSKGLRDRRVRLSVNTAIQFYDLQDRLGYDQPSKAVEWLLKAAAPSIADLPPMTNPFPDTPKRSSTAGSDHLCIEVETDVGGGDLRFSQLTKSSGGAACSSTSETSKGSGLSASRSESRMRAKGRVAEKESECYHVEAGSMNPISHTTSFTELLSGDDGRHWSSTPMDYLGELRPPLPGNPFTFGELQHISLLSDLGHNGDYNLNFTMSSSSADNSAGYSRGTLQSNSSPPQSSMYTNNSDGFYTAAPVENHHQFQSAGYDARLQLCYGSNTNNGKPKNWKLM